MKAETTIATVVKAWRAANGVSIKELAQRVGVKRQNIEQLEAGLVQHPRYIKRLADVIGLTSDELLATTEATDDRHLEAEKRPSIRRIPVLVSPSRVEWGPSGPRLTNLDPAVQRVATAVEVSASAFAVRVQGDAMLNPSGSPSFPSGTMLIVEPARLPEPGQFVVARQPGGEAFIFKRYALEFGRPLLESLNPRYPLVELPSNAEICGVVVSAELPLV